MSLPFRFKCSQCEEWHEGIPHLNAYVPVEYLHIPPEERERRAILTEETCVIDGQWYFIRVDLELPIQECEERLAYGVWVSISERSFARFKQTYAQEGREETLPFFAWLTAVPPSYPPAALKAMVHLQPWPNRPQLELEPTDHPLAVAQRSGVLLSTVERVIEQVMHAHGGPPQ